MKLVTTTISGKGNIMLKKYMLKKIILLALLAGISNHNINAMQQPTDFDEDMTILELMDLMRNDEPIEEPEIINTNEDEPIKEPEIINTNGNVRSIQRKPSFFRQFCDGMIEGLGELTGMVIGGAAGAITLFLETELEGKKAKLIDEIRFGTPKPQKKSLDPIKGVF
jgi:hypothetical protein